jgi:hypothetical protein
MRKERGCRKTRTKVFPHKGEAASDVVREPYLRLLSGGHFKDLLTKGPF